MVFKDRKQAGQLLAERLTHLGGERVLVLGIPRGGVVVAKEVAEKLGAELDVVVTKKLSAPRQEELAIGAIAEQGEPIWDEQLAGRLGADEEYKASEVREKRKKVADYIEKFRRGRSLAVAGKTVVLVDDGIATGQTMVAAIEYLKARMPSGEKGKLVVAVPTCAQDSYKEIKPKVEELICLDLPAWFGAVGQFYEDFDQVSDEEVKEILIKVRSQKSQPKAGRPMDEKVKSTI